MTPPVTLACPDHDGIDHNDDDGWHEHPDQPCAWTGWEFNHWRTCEIRFCSRCGEMEQQWIE